MNVSGLTTLSSVIFRVVFISCLYAPPNNSAFDEGALQQ
jgi:hypothetical protein